MIDDPDFSKSIIHLLVFLALKNLPTGFCCRFYPLSILLPQF